MGGTDRTGARARDRRGQRGREHRSRRALGGVLAILVVAVGLAGCARMPDTDTFYTAPVTPKQAPGEVVRYRSSTVGDDPISGQQVPDVQAWQVIYRSTTATDQPNVVSGTVIVPTTPWTGEGPRPLVSYGPGTRGVGDRCAPSFTLAVGTDYELGWVKLMLRRGYAVAMTDYEGLGTPGQHTYMVGRSQGHAALDMARAALRLPGAGLGADTPIALWGYSQGGATSAWAAQLAPDYAPELHLEAAVMGGVPADLLAVSQRLDGGLFVSFGLLAALGFDTAYPGLKVQDYLNDKGEELWRTAQSMCLVGLEGIGTFLGVAGTKLTDYVTTDPRDTPIWKQRLGANKVGASAPEIPIYQYQGVDDQIAPYAQAKELRDRWCGEGADVTFVPYTGIEHVGGFLVGVDPALTYLDQVFAGDVPAGNCRTQF